jgi:hypothetical protein
MLASIQNGQNKETLPRCRWCQTQRWGCSGCPPLSGCVCVMTSPPYSPYSRLLHVTMLPSLPGSDGVNGRGG